MTHSGFGQAEKNAQDGFRVLYIFSSGRSGSTLTDMFMGGHSQIASLGQINILGKVISLGAKCSCGSELRTCQNVKLLVGNCLDDLAELTRLADLDIVLMRKTG